MAPAELVARIAEAIRACGLEPTLQDGAVTGGARFVKAKWWLGRALGSYRMSCRLDEPLKKAFFRESVAITTLGLAPPAFIAEKSSLAGRERSGEVSIHTPFGSGTMRYEALRKTVEGIVTDAGWRFVFEAGRLP